MNLNSKDNLIGKIRMSSLLVGILCVIGVLVNVCIIMFNVFGTAIRVDETIKMTLLSNNLSLAAETAILLLAAVLCFSMFRSGRPFTPKKIRAVLLIALLFFLKTLICNLIYGISLSSELPKMLAMLFLRGGWLESILFLFAALIMYYASFLQQESDETL